LPPNISQTFKLNGTKHELNKKNVKNAKNTISNVKTKRKKLVPTANPMPFIIIKIKKYKFCVKKKS
jgi:hypothetical protein